MTTAMTWEKRSFFPTLDMLPGSFGHSGDVRSGCRGMETENSCPLLLCSGRRPALSSARTQKQMTEKPASCADVCQTVTQSSCCGKVEPFVYLRLLCCSLLVCFTCPCSALLQTSFLPHLAVIGVVTCQKLLLPPTQVSGMAHSSLSKRGLWQE